MTYRILARATSLGMVVAAAALLVSTPVAGAAVTAPIAQPATATGASKVVKMVVTNGQQIVVTPTTTKAGRTFFAKQLRGKRVVIACTGIDAANTTEYLFWGEGKWKPKARQLRLKLAKPAVLSGCGIGKSLLDLAGVSFGVVDLEPDAGTPAPDAHYVKELHELATAAGSLLIAAAFQDEMTPSIEQLVSYGADLETALPLAAMANATAFPTVTTHYGVWTDGYGKVFRTTQLLADGQQLAGELHYMGIRTA